MLFDQVLNLNLSFDGRNNKEARMDGIIIGDRQHYYNSASVNRYPFAPPLRSLITLIAFNLNSLLIIFNAGYVIVSAIFVNCGN